MAKSRPFSVHLLKVGIDATNALKADTGLVRCARASNLPPGSTMFILDAPSTVPWWRGYFGVEQELRQAHKGAILFLPIADRWFALTFGHVAHNLRDGCYEYDFGLRVTLNAVDPLELKSTDTLEPGVSRRQRTQLPTGSDLTVFDIDKDSSILKGLTGKVKAEYRGFFKQATGASSFHFSTDVPAREIGTTCQKLLEIFAKEDYKTAFPDIRAIEPVRDPAVLSRLESRLLEALRGKDPALTLTVPELINYRDVVRWSFKGAGRSKVYEDVALPCYHEYLLQHGFGLDAIDVKALRKHALCLCDEDGQEKDSFDIYKCCLFDTGLGAAGPTYHLCDGNWYAVERSYVDKLRTDLDRLFEASSLPAYCHDDEGAYNTAVGATCPTHICLDKTSVAPAGQTPVEPCDLYSVAGEVAVHTHVKVSTRSQQLSHLFNQGANAVELLRADESARNRMLALVRDRLNGRDARAFLSPIEQDKHSVVFAIATHKPADKRSDNLPLFSRISLRRCARFLQLMNVPVRCCYLTDSRGRPAGRERGRPAASPAAAPTSAAS